MLFEMINSDGTTNDEETFEVDWKDLELGDFPQDGTEMRIYAIGAVIETWERPRWAEGFYTLEITTKYTYGDGSQWFDAYVFVPAEAIDRVVCYEGAVLTRS